MLTRQVWQSGSRSDILFSEVWDFLQNQIVPANQVPIGIDENFKTPNTLGFSVGIQREISERYRA